MMFKDFLKEIASFIVVVGSYARHEETKESDIDCYLRWRPRDEVDPELENDSYMDDIIRIVERYGYEWTSVVMGHIAIERQCGVPRMVEISSYYKIPTTSKLFYRNIYGVDLLCAADDKTCDISKCYDDLEWDEELIETVIHNPLPTYSTLH